MVGELTFRRVNFVSVGAKNNGVLQNRFSDPRFTFLIRKTFNTTIPKSVVAEKKIGLGQQLSSVCYACFPGKLLT